MGGSNEIDEAANQFCSQRKYTLGARLGEGAHKVAYVVQGQDQKQFALKIARITAALRPRFEREAAALRGCNHGAIAILQESAAMVLGAQEYWVSVEEYLPRGTLAARLGAGPLDTAFVVDLGLRLAEALLHLHERNLVHRDIKPANIVFRSEREPVLTDFGIVRMLEQPTLTVAHLPHGPGTPLYAAPEQLNNEKELIDWRTDQFCLGLVLAEAALGYHPFTPERDPAIAVTRMHNRNSMPSSSVDALNAMGFGALTKALSPWPVRRFRAPNDLICAISLV